MGKMQRTRRVGGQVFDQDTRRRLCLSLSPAPLRGQDVEEPSLPERIGQADVDETRTRHRDLREVFAARGQQVLDDDLRQSARLLASCLCESQGSVGGVVAVLGALGPLDRNAVGTSWQTGLALRLIHCSLEKSANPASNTGGHLPTL